MSATGNETPLNKILITGAAGQLGQELIRLDLDNVKMIGLDRALLDITNEKQCREVIAELKPDVIIHAAAYTAVDRAESEPDMAWKVNVLGTSNVAAAAEWVGAKFCYISTDYVFDGTSDEPYGEASATNPQTVYGRTKLEGEKVALETCSKVFIVRTSWVYGKYGANFVRTMLNLAEQQKELSVVHDQVGSPTYAFDLAQFLVELVKTDKYGVYHASNSGACTWYDFAKAIFEEAELLVTLIPCTTEQFLRPAPRPAFSVLAHDATIRAELKPLRHWREALNEFLRKV